MKIALLGAGAFVIGLGIGTGVAVMRAPKPAAHPAPAASAADSAVHADARTAPGPIEAAAPAVAPDSTHRLPDTAALPAQQVAAAAAAARPAAPPAALHAPAPAPDYAGVAKILSNMKPVEAAKIVAYLGDDQVEGILRSVGARQAALMLAQLPVERAAAMSRRLLRPATEVSR